MQQYEALAEYPDAEAVWHLMARALRHSNEGSRPWRQLFVSFRPLSSRGI